jgi:hypothetical protein
LATKVTRRKKETKSHKNYKKQSHRLKSTRVKTTALHRRLGVCYKEEDKP